MKKHSTILEMEELLKEIGTRLKKYLDKKDLTVNQLGKMSDNEGTQIYNIVNGKNYGIDKFLKVIKQTEDLNLYWLIWNEGGEKNMFRKPFSYYDKRDSVPAGDANEASLLKEIENLKSTISYQNITIDVYKNSLEISRASIEDLRKIVDFYTAKNGDTDQDDQLNSNAG